MSRFIGLARKWGVIAAAVAGLAMPAMAQDFKVAMSSPPTSMDPHFQNITTNANVIEHMFEPLVMRSADGRLAPALAASWTNVNNLTWDFKLRPGAKFSDGSPVTIDDVIYSLDRPASIKNSPASFTQYTRSITGKRAIDAQTLRITTGAPTPLLPDDLVSIIIVSKKATEGLASDDFAAGKGMVGSGPYKFVRFLRDDRVEMARNEHYNGPNKTPWATTTIRFIANPSTRLAALLAGDVQAIENVPTPDLARVRSNANLNLITATSQRMVFLFADWREKSPFLTDKSGAVLAKNPLQDVRVRRALSMAINREAIRERVMEGLSESTENLVVPGSPGHVSSMAPVKFDPDGAKKMLAEAGYPNGFGLTVHGPNNRLVNDEKIAQTIAQMFTRVGVDSKVDTMPMAVYAPRGGKFEFSVALIAWGGSVDLSIPMRALLACENAARGMGVVNWSKYCNPKLDELLGKAESMDPLIRDRTLREAAGIISQDVAIIPLHFQVSAWAAKKGITYQGRGDERTYAFNFKPN